MNDDPATTRGVQFPEVDGQRSTTATGRAVFADAARPIDPDLAERISRAPKWHTSYLGYVRDLLAAELADPFRGAAVPGAGLDSLYDRMEFIRDGETLRLDRAVGAFDTPALRTVTVEGEAAARSDGLRVPYGGQQLGGDALRAQLRDWIDRGIVEPSFAEAIELVIANPDWLDLADQRFVLLGAGAEMGPLESLCAWGAEVVVLDRPRPHIWESILAAVRAGTGRAQVPVPIDATVDADLTDVAGTDLITALPEVALWLRELEGPVTIGNHVYADGAKNVQVSMAVDALIVDVGARDPRTRLAALATPTDVFAVPEAVVADAQRRHADASRAWPRIARTMSRGKLYVPNYEDGVVTTPSGRRAGIADVLVAQQGPNYVLAKRLHRWRAHAMRAAGHHASINVAPATATRSVMKNRILAAAYRAANRFGVEVFAPDTSNTLMAALLVHDLRNDKSSASPDVTLDHPQELLSEAAAHGGLWRMPFAPRSVLPLAAIRGLLPGAPGGRPSM